MIRTLQALLLCCCCPVAVWSDEDVIREYENIAVTDAVQVGAYYYPWYGANGRHWNDGVPREPALGRYDSADEQTVNRHIDWATGHGIDFFAVSWWGPESFEDAVLRASFLPADLSAEIGFAIMYETTGRLRDRDGEFDLEARNRERLVDDFRYLAETFFDAPNYVRIDGRPVVFIYLSRIMTGDLVAGLEAVRVAVQEECGVEPFLIGDEVYWHAPSVERLSVFDGVTPYNMHTSVPDVAEWFSRELPGKYEEWRAASESADVLFVPGVIPGFNDSAVRPEARHPTIPRNTALFEEQIRLALDASDDEQPIIMLNSWNEWHEDTAIEPAEDFGLTYLEVLRQVLRSR